MNLKPLFDKQKELDTRIVKEKGLEGQDLLPKKILALQVELGELANEWRGFKFWSNDQKPRVKEPITAWGEPYKNPLLEEYVDCLHFILSIGLELHYEINNSGLWKVNEITPQFLEVNHHANNIYYGIESDWDMNEIFDEYENLFEGFVGLGEMLGFTWEQIEQAYMDKNKVNHARQDNGY